MLKVSTVHLGPDCASADARHGTRELGQLAPEAFAALLEKFRVLDAAQNHAHEPLITVQSPTGKFFIRTGGGKLYLYNARDTTQPYSELTVPGLLEALGAVSLSPDPTTDESLANFPDTAPRRPPRTLLAIMLLLIGLTLNFGAIYAYFRTDERSTTPSFTPITDAAMAARYRGQVSGVYATGSQPGDRMIILSADGAVKFRQLSSGAASSGESGSTYTVGLSNQLLRLATPRYGAIIVQSDGSLLYYGDTYHRASQ